MMIPFRKGVLLSVLGAALGVAAFSIEYGLAGRAAVPASFALQEVRGGAVKTARDHGRWSLVFFGYTHCPDFCPTALTTAGGALHALGPDAGRVRMVFVTLDPARDTPGIMVDYLQAFDPRIEGLTGNPEQIAAAAASFKVYFSKRELPGGDYSIDHTAAFWLLDPEGHPAEVYAYDTAPEALAEALRGRLDTPPV
jgi:protein SCO1/2